MCGHPPVCVEPSDLVDDFDGASLAHLGDAKDDPLLLVHAEHLEPRESPSVAGENRVDGVVDTDLGGMRNASQRCGTCDDVVSAEDVAVDRFEGTLFGHAEQSPATFHLEDQS